MAKLNLSSPWVIFYREIEALFSYDWQVHVIYDEDTNVIKLYVDNPTKADALSKLLPTEKDFGNVTLYIEIIPMNSEYVSGVCGNVFDVAFDGNPIVSYVQEISGIFSNPLLYIVFRNEVVQYFNDSLGDIHGICSTLWQEIAKDVFVPMANVYYCTDFPEDKKTLQSTMKIWP